MRDPSMALQLQLRTRFLELPELTEKVPPDNIVDRQGLPERVPCILFGEGQVLPEYVTLSRKEVRAVLDLHVWTAANSSITAREIGGEIREALKERLPVLQGWRVITIDLTTRSVRDPSGKYGHVVATVEALMEEI